MPRIKPERHTVSHCGESKEYIFGYCNEKISTDLKALSANANIPDRARNLMAIPVHVFVCHNCDSPTYFDWNGKQHPGMMSGNAVEGIDDPHVAVWYDEARACMQINAYTRATLCCRKFLMNIAVHKGAGEDLKFFQYVEYFHKNNFTPPGNEE